MRLRRVNRILLVVVAFVLTLRPALADDRAEPAKSTIRIVSASTPPAAPEASPPRIVIPSQPAEPKLPPQVQPPEPAPIEVVAVPPAPTAERYPVSQAIHTAPLTAAPNAITSMNAALARKSAPPSGHVPAVVNVYSSANAQAMLSRMPRRMTVQPQPNASQTPRRGKPFQSIQMEPAVSPYLNMYRRDVDGSNLPNYFAFVLPQLEQQQVSRQQAAELQKLRGQVQSLGAVGAAPDSPNMSAHARYMDTAQYYSRLKR